MPTYETCTKIKGSWNDNLIAIIESKRKKPISEYKPEFIEWYKFFFARSKWRNLPMPPMNQPYEWSELVYDL